MHIVFNHGHRYLLGGQLLPHSIVHSCHKISHAITGTGSIERRLEKLTLGKRIKPISFKF
jgi:hypothetical protein